MKALFVPSISEGKKIFPGCKFEKYKHDLHKGEFRGVHVFVIGVSKIPSVFNSIMAIKDFNITEAILTGVCGAYSNSGLSVGDVVSIHRDWFADEGLYTGDGFTSLNELGFGIIKKRYTEYSTLENLTVVDSATVSFLDGVGHISEMFQKSTGAQVENMEGAAFAYACNMLSVKCFQIRAVSNFCGKRDEQEWDFKKAVSKLKRFFELLPL
ncbi:MAG: hypothetical protein C0602_08800 [Denitrovibrio sp.]|nr:MAG: hypothetical protein C0602_08800 [Denitrovibrio sp.]